MKKACGSSVWKAGKALHRSSRNVWVFDAVLTVWAPREVRHARLRDFRGFDETEILRREKLQMSADEKLERADYALVNSGDAALLEKQFSHLLREFNKRKES